MPDAPRFDDHFRQLLCELFRWRRDVRHFKRDPIAEDLVNNLLNLACLAPSVGLSEPWRFVLVQSLIIREEVRAEFSRANQDALCGYHGDQAEQYAKLQLSGLEEAPVHLAVFTDQGTTQGHGLGRQTMPETLNYSAVMAVHTLWLAARAYGVGVGWVSIINPAHVTKLLNVPDSWYLTAYLCIGFPEEEFDTPELQRTHWEHRAGRREHIFSR